MTERNIPTEHDDGATLPTENPNCQWMTARLSYIPILPSSSLTKTPPRQRLRFDNYDHFEEIPTRKALTEGGYFDFLNQHDLQSPLYKDEKRKVLVSTAEKTRQVSQPGISVPARNKPQKKCIFKKRSLERSNRGQPPPSNNNYSVRFELNMCAHSVASVDIPENVRIMQGDLFRDQNANFGHSVSSDMAMSSGIAPQFVGIFPGSQELRNLHKNIKA